MQVTQPKSPCAIGICCFWFCFWSKQQTQHNHHRHHNNNQNSNNRNNHSRSHAHNNYLYIYIYIQPFASAACRWPSCWPAVGLRRKAVFIARTPSAIMPAPTDEEEVNIFLQTILPADLLYIFHEVKLPLDTTKACPCLPSC